MSKTYFTSIAIFIGILLLAGANYSYVGAESGFSRDAYDSPAKDQSQNEAARITIVKSGIEQEAAGLDLQVNIVGFDIKEVEARKQLEAIAASTGGIYLDAKDSEQLLESLEQTLRIEFVLLDYQGRVKARGVVGGEPVQVLDGTYRLKLLLQPEPLEIRITVKPDAKATLTLKKEGDQWILK